MDERRKNKRTGLSSRLQIKRLDGDEDHKVSIKITDVSKNGIGFECKEQLQVGELYESSLTIWTKEVIHVILRIVRIEQEKSIYSCGAVFVGMPDAEATRIGVYQTIEDIRKNQ